MNKLIVVFALLIFVSCSRYHHLPRAKEQNKSTLLVTDSRLTMVTINEEHELETIITETQQTMVNQPKKELLVIRDLEITKLKKENIYSNAKSEKPSSVKSITNDSVVKNNKYQTLHKLILGSVLLTVLGVILALEAYLFGYLILVLGIFMLLIFLFGLILTFLVDKLRNKKTKSPKNPAPIDSQNKDKTKTKKKFDKVNLIFLNLLICNFIVWLIGKFKIKN